MVDNEHESIYIAQYQCSKFYEVATGRGEMIVDRRRKVAPCHEQIWQPRLREKIPTTYVLLIDMCDNIRLVVESIGNRCKSETVISHRTKLQYAKASNW